MGTNYFLNTGKKEKVVCEYGCEHEIDEVLHIGKYSSGWKFCLHIIPEKNINNLEDWKNILKEGKIYDEYNVEISYDKMLKTIIGDYVDKGLELKIHEIAFYITMFDPNDNLYYVNKDKLAKDGSYVLVEGDFG